MPHRSAICYFDLHLVDIPNGILLYMPRVLGETGTGMKANLDKWIKDAKDEVPESGEYRRLNRAMLKERMAVMAPRRRRRHRVLLGVLSLVFLMLFSGQLNQLGSDSFDVVREDEDFVSPWGTIYPLMKNEFRGNSFTVPRSYSAEDIDELNRSLAAGEGKIELVKGTSFGGKTVWTKIITRVVNGKIENRGTSLEDRPYEVPDDWDNFVLKHYREMDNKTKSMPHQRETVMTFDGVACEMKIWVFHFPEFGEVIFYMGTPIQEQ